MQITARPLCRSMGTVLKHLSFFYSRMRGFESSWKFCDIELCDCNVMGSRYFFVKKLFDMVTVEISHYFRSCKPIS